MADVAHKRSSSQLDNNILEDVKAILIAADGTITTRSFVKDILLSFLKENLQSYLEHNFDNDEVQAAIEELRQQAAEDAAAAFDGAVVIPGPDSNQVDVVTAVVSSVQWLLKSGRKTDSLKHLQGIVWSFGFKNAEIRGRVYDDVVPALEKLMRNDVKVFVYSSSLGTETQRLLLTFSNLGDLSEMFSGFFDTISAGVSVEKESYSKIVANIELNAENILYITTQPTEMTAANAAGLKTCLMSREANVDDAKDEDRSVSSFVISSFLDLFRDSDEIPAKRIRSGVDENIVVPDDASDGSEGCKGTSDDAEAGDESPLE